MTDELIRAVAESPNDDGPRLVYADWLQQQPDEVSRARGEYIALSCTAVRPKPTARIDELLAKYEPAWLGPLRSLLEVQSWSRGFLDSCNLRAHPMRVEISAALEHPNWCVVRALYTDNNSHFPAFEQIAQLICQREMSNLKALRTNIQVLQQMVESARAPRITELTYSPWSGESLTELLPLLDAECFARLTRLLVLRCSPGFVMPLVERGIEVIVTHGPPRSIASWLAALTSMRATLRELRLVLGFTDVFERRDTELVLHGEAGRWVHLEIRWTAEDLRSWRDEVIDAIASLPAGALEKLSFVGPPTAKFDVARFKQRVTAAAPGAIVV